MLEDDKPRDVEVEGKTVDEAVRKALIMTGWTRDQIAIEVLNRGGGGAWAGGAQARVRVSRKSGDALELARKVTADVLERMGLSGMVQAEVRPDHIRVVVQGDELEEKLVGRDGEGLDALQHLVARIVSKQSGSRQMVSVDLGGYRLRRERELRDMAYQLADAVRQTGHPVMTEPMGAGERRVVHLALNEDPDIATFAVGDGLVKPITIAPIDQAPPPEERRPSHSYPGRGQGRDREEGAWRSGSGGGRRGPRSEREGRPGPRGGGRSGGSGSGSRGGRGGGWGDRRDDRSRERSRDGWSDRGRQGDGGRHRSDPERHDDRNHDRERGRGRRDSEPSNRRGGYEPARGGESPGDRGF